MTTIYLVRHGDVHNPDKLFYGRLPGFPLSELGRKQAQKLGVHLKAKKITAIYTSPLERAHETAREIHAHFPHLTITPDERIIEVFSPAQGKPFADLAPTRWNFFLPQFIEQGGETMEAIWARMDAFLRDAVAKYAGEEIVAVSHGDPIMLTKATLSGKKRTFAHIRGDDYVDTATGVALLYEGTRCVSVVDIVP